MDTSQHRPKTDPAAALAPHVDPSWAERFVVEQRLLGVPGSRIGDALATVEAHVVDSGESAAAAFGEPREYARELAAASGARPDPLATSTVVGSVLGLVSIVLLPRALGHWLAGEPVAVTVGDAVAAGVLALLCVLLFRFPSRALRALAERAWVGALAGLLLVGGFVAVLALLPQQVAELPAPWVATAGVAALLGATALLWRQPADPVQGPAGRRARGDRSARWVTAAIFPGLTLVMCLAVWLLHLVG